MRIVRILLLLLCFALVNSGCDPDRNEFPAEIEGAHHITTLHFGSTIADLYAESTSFFVRPTRLFIYFPDGTPSDPLTGVLKIECTSLDYLEGQHGGTTNNQTPPSFCCPIDTTQIDDRWHLYSTMIHPFQEGRWKIDFIWEDSVLNLQYGSYKDVTVEHNHPFDRVVFLHGISVRDNPLNLNYVLSWITPPVIDRNENTIDLTFRVWWSGENQMMNFNLDTSLSIYFTIDDNNSAALPKYSASLQENDYHVQIQVPEETEEWDLFPHATLTNEQHPDGVPVELPHFNVVMQ